MAAPLDVGFIGLGSMGQPMAANLVAAGHHVRVWARSREKAAPLLAAGAHWAPCAEDTLGGDVLVSMLADDEAYRSLFASRPMLAEASPGAVHLNMATVSATFARAFAAAHAEAGLRYVSAPVFGRAAAAAAGQLAVLAAGDAAALELVRPLLGVLGRKTWELGADPGAANVVKIAGNFLVASSIEALAEAAALAEAHDIAPRVLMEVITGALFDTPVYRTYGSLIAERSFSPAGFRLDLGLKDVRLALAAGDEKSMPLPLASLLRDTFLDAIAHGDADLDWAAVAEVARRRGGH